MLPRIAITIGDPAGIGPEVALRAAHDATVLSCCRPILFGDARILRAVGEKLGLPVPRHVYGAQAWPQADAPTPAILDLPMASTAEFRPGEVSRETGAASYGYILAAIDAAMRGQVDAVTTGPIHKEALDAAGVPYPGHTEIFAAKTLADRVCMMLTSSELTCSFVTTHVGYRDVPGLLNQDRVRDVIELSDQAIRRMQGREPRLIVCGLNPHAGENGLFGEREEERFIIPAIRDAQQRGIQVAGPLPPDTAFLPARRRATDCFICMYHDQGHIPLKALAFDLAVNITLGLPIIRTSVDHGTALDIAWHGVADASSMVQAITLAAKLCGRPEPAAAQGALR
ncbi:4-hydroxythreonine-4-phosphate dehydrogenase [Pirellulimonas nuda]|uniref:4-hydroxythreonine-4-phosphate dehydrogenase n=1 Tax=Pirellulimonas nuda TaxID=2528009 RepID=A0A518DAQ0_9BACT|nr:4-hydroxythreonine-4-phosphate dehydrogenase PdxA [Pirellulimonas nuda]QDU88559.1 4-hydroxythreonine-4-phosphate dehydrogenase [Pirellulimonas nuda]